MTNQDGVTLRDIYEAVNQLRYELKNEIKDIKDDVEINTNFRNQLMGKMTAVFAIIGISINLIWDYIFNRKP